jgi:hypothetical protein
MSQQVKNELIKELNKRMNIVKDFITEIEAMDANDPDFEKSALGKIHELEKRLK